ncbi:ATP-binding protein [Streptomyces sp. O3]
MHPIAATPLAAPASATASAPVASWRTALPHTLAAVPMARGLVRSALAEAEGVADRDTAELLTAELVANAVEHTPQAAPLELVIELLPGGCRVEVHDPDPAPPGDLSASCSADQPDPWQEHGRGLLLIRALSQTCGHRPTAAGKAVWFTLATVPVPTAPVPTAPATAAPVPTAPATAASLPAVP